MAIVANEARTRRRAAGRRAGWTLRAADAARSEPTASPGPEDAALDAETRAGLLAALAQLDERDRTVLALRYLLDLGESEMAAVLDCRRGTVKSRLSRALERLRVVMAS